MFLHFLRLCLESEDKRPTVSELLQHEFLVSEATHGPHVPRALLRKTRSTRVYSFLLPVGRSLRYGALFLFSGVE